jgi:methionyl-tRNA synthetase
MIDQSNKWYVTTPIYYVNAKPHLGTLYSTVLADVIARYQKLSGKKVYFLTGTDEHGQKIAEAAAAQGLSPQEFVDKMAPAFKDMWHAYGIEFNHFIRTTDKSHIKTVQKWLIQLQEKGHIYKATYEGWYCVPDEAFILERDVKEFKDGTPLCPNCNRPLKFMSEESYFFKLSAYQDKLSFFEENPHFIAPAERLHEVKNFVASGLKDLSISRRTVTWGIPFPGDEQHVTYVWADALCNYLSAIGYLDPHRTEEFNFWWPADTQVMAKDIVRFHAVYWLAFLMASELPLPKKLVVHGWIKIGDQKMSKSLGNAVDPHMLLEKYGAEPIRYYLTRYMAINQDSPFSESEMIERMNADLANDFGNLLNRVITLSLKNGLSTVHAPSVWSPAVETLRDDWWTTLEEFKAEMNNYYFHRAYARLWKFVQLTNAYLHAEEPWKIAATDKQKFNEVMSAALHAIYNVAILTLPIMPKAMEQALSALGMTFKKEHDYIEELNNNPWNLSFVLKSIPPLFVKHEPLVMTEPTATTAPKVELDTISIDEVNKVILLVGTIENVEEVPKSDKLYKLTVNLGLHGTRIVLSGVRQHFAPADLLNKQGVFVSNLAPRKMVGLESQGMMLFAEDEKGRLRMVTIESFVPNGTRLR